MANNPNEVGFFVVLINLFFSRLRSNIFQSPKLKFIILILERRSMNILKKINLVSLLN